MSAALTVADAAPLLREGAESLRVTDGGRVIGRVTRAAVVDLMLAG